MKKEIDRERERERDRERQRESKSERGRARERGKETERELVEKGKKEINNPRKCSIPSYLSLTLR